MATLSLRKVQDGIGDDLRAIVSRGRNASAYLDRVIWPAYQQAQVDRWASENSSQGPRWNALSPSYAKSKPKRFAAYPGGGRALMVATSRLSQGAQGRDTAYFMRSITDKTITVAINLSALPYASYPAKTRPFMNFSDEQISEWTDGVAQYVMKGKREL